MEKDSIYVRHILDAIKNIESFINGKVYPAFLKDKLLQDGVVRELEIIGEASKKLSEKFKGDHVEIPWADVAGMREKLAHDYFSVDLEIVWNTAKKDILQLKSVLLRS